MPPSNLLRHQAYMLCTDKQSTKTLTYIKKINNFKEKNIIPGHAACNLLLTAPSPPNFASIMNSKDQLGHSPHNLRTVLAVEMSQVKNFIYKPNNPRSAPEPTET